MDDQQTPADPNPPAAGGLDPAQSPTPTWTVKFVVPREAGMPSDRLKARAELVRAATGCDCCMCGGSSY
jgi:hypothetical protein